MSTRDLHGSLHGKDGRYTEDARDIPTSTTLTTGEDPRREFARSRVKDFIGAIEPIVEEDQQHIRHLTSAADVHVGSVASALSSLAAHKGEHDAYKWFEQFIEDETWNASPEQALMETVEKSSRYAGRAADEVRNGASSAQREGFDRGLRELTKMVKDADKH